MYSTPETRKWEKLGERRVAHSTLLACGIKLFDSAGPFSRPRIGIPDSEPVKRLSVPIFPSAYPPLSVVSGSKEIRGDDLEEAKTRQERGRRIYRRPSTNRRFGLLVPTGIESELFNSTDSQPEAAKPHQ